MDLCHWLERHADFSPDRIALEFEERSFSWSVLHRDALRMAAVLATLGVGSGERVAQLGYNSPAFLSLLFACARLGALLVPLNWRMAVPELAPILTDAEPLLLLHDRDFAATAGALPGPRALLLDELQAQLDRTPEHRGSSASERSPLLIIYTSGTTGRPKGVVLTQEALLWNALNAAHMHDLTSDDHVLTTLPMFHVGGLNIQTTPALHAGARITLHRRFDPAATLAAIVKSQPTLMVLVPAQIAALIAHPLWAETDLTSLRLLATGSQIVPRHLIDAMHARGVPVIQIYGSTETAPIALYQTRRDAFVSIGSCGKPALHGEARIVDRDGKDVAPGERGEILIRGPQVMTGYWHDPTATAAALQDGWFHSGDIGHVDTQGFYWIDERKHDVIISGGENIYPAELESILAADPRIAEAVVVARPDPRWGEVPVAVVVRAGTIEVGEVLALFQDRIARFKQPRDVVFVPELPRNVLGKVQRHVLRETVKS